MGVIDPEAGEKVMDASTHSMRHSSAIWMRLWKMWREAESQVSLVMVFFRTDSSPNIFLCRLIILTAR